MSLVGPNPFRGDSARRESRALRCWGCGGQFSLLVPDANGQPKCRTCHPSGFRWQAEVVSESASEEA